jgi:hypothetical protein
MFEHVLYDAWRDRSRTEPKPLGGVLCPGPRHLLIISIIYSTDLVMKVLDFGVVAQSVAIETGYND